LGKLVDIFNQRVNLGGLELACFNLRAQQTQ